MGSTGKTLANGQSDRREQGQSAKLIVRIRAIRLPQQPSDATERSLDRLFEHETHATCNGEAFERLTIIARLCIPMWRIPISTFGSTVSKG